MVGVIPNERAPGLSPAPGRSGRADVSLDGALRVPNPELEEFAADALGAPEPVISFHLLDQRDGLARDPWLPILRPGLPLPEKSEPGAVPAQQGLRLHDQQRACPCFCAAREQYKPASGGG